MGFFCRNHFYKKRFSFIPRDVDSLGWPDLIQSCECTDGCPSCVGPKMEVGERGKAGALRLIDWILG